MLQFSRQSGPALNVIITLRFSEAQVNLLDDLASRLGLGKRAETIRTAIDYWLNHSPEVVELLSQLRCPQDQKCGRVYPRKKSKPPPS